MAVDGLLSVLVTAAFLGRGHAVKASADDAAVEDAAVEEAAVLGDGLLLLRPDAVYPGRAAWPVDAAQEWDPGPQEYDDDAGDYVQDGVAAAAPTANRRQGEAVGAEVELAPARAEAPTTDVGMTEAAAVQQDKAEVKPADGGSALEDNVAEAVEARSSFSIPDSLAAESEALPMPAPLSMGGRGPPMTLSLEDMDYLTILRPPAQSKGSHGGPPHGGPHGPQGHKQVAAPKGGKGVVAAGPRGGKNKRKGSNNSNNNNNTGGKGGKAGPKSKAPSSSNKNNRPRPPQTPPPPPGPPGPMAPMAPMAVAPPYDPYNSYGSPYDPPHPYGFGYGYNGYDYPRYQDPVMTHEYQQATSYPEEERFRPVGSPMRHPGPSLASPMTSPMTSPSSLPGSSLPPLTSPMTASTTPGYDSYAAGFHNHRDYPLPASPSSSPTSPSAPTTPATSFNSFHDQRPSGSGAVQVSQSVSLAEQHSANWLGSSTAAPSTATATADGTKKATLKDILAQDCPGAEELGYCDSPPRYPMQQVAEAIQRCSQLLEHMYAPPPEERDPEAGEGEGEGACQSVRRTLRPGYVRDAASGRWLVSLQSRGRVVQKVAVERCSAPGRPCARLSDSKCARNLGFRNGARPTSCDQRHALLPVITWDPETPATCPRVRLARFPTACVCRVG